MGPLAQTITGALLILTPLLPIACGVLWWRLRAARRECADYAATIEANGAMIAELQLHFDAQVENIMEQHRNAIERLHIDFSSEQRKAKEYFETISRCEAEKLQWRDLYHQQSREHGNAQAALLDEREKNIRLLMGNKIRPYLNPHIERLVGAFREQHYEPTKLAAISEKLGLTNSGPVDTPPPNE